MQKFLMIPLLVLVITACQQKTAPTTGPQPQALYGFSSSCSGGENWYCHAECCNGYSQDGCIEDSVPGSTYQGDSELEGAPDSAQGACESYATAVCQQVGSLPLMAIDQFYVTGSTSGTERRATFAGCNPKEPPAN